MAQLAGVLPQAPKGEDLIAYQGMYSDFGSIPGLGE